MSSARLLQLPRHSLVSTPYLLCTKAVITTIFLADFPTVAQFALSSLKALEGVLSSGDQYHLYSTAQRALVTARRRGDSRVIEYWSGRPIISISIAPYAIHLYLL